MISQNRGGDMKPIKFFILSLILLSGILTAFDAPENMEFISSENSGPAMNLEKAGDYIVGSAGGKLYLFNENLELLNTFSNLKGIVYDVIFDPALNYIYIANGVYGLHVFTITQNSLSKIFEYSEIKAFDLDLKDNKLLVSKKDNGLNVFTISENSLTPSAIFTDFNYSVLASSFIDIDGNNYFAIFSDYNNCYIINNESGFFFEIIAEIPQNFKKAVYKDGFIFIAGEGFFVIDVSNPYEPQIHSAIIGTDFTDIHVNNGTTALSAGFDGMHFFDITNPMNTVFTGKSEIDGFCYKYFTHNNSYYISNYNNGFKKYSIDSEFLSEEISSFSDDHFVSSKCVHVNDDIVYIGTLNSGIYVYKKNGNDFDLHFVYSTDNAYKEIVSNNDYLAALSEDKPMQIFKLMQDGSVLEKIDLVYDYRPIKIQFSGGLLYMLEYDGIISAFKIDDSGNLREVFKCEQYEFSDFLVQDYILFGISDNSCKFRVFDINGLNYSREIGRCTFSEPLDNTMLSFYNKTCYLGVNNNALYSILISNSGAPVIYSKKDFDYNYTSLKIQDSYLYTAGANGKIFAYNLKNSVVQDYECSITGPGIVFDMDLIGNQLFTVNGFNIFNLFGNKNAAEIPHDDNNIEVRRVKLVNTTIDNNVTVSVSTFNEFELDIRIHNVLGQLVHTETVLAERGSKEIPISTGHLSSGLYFIQMTGGGMNERGKFIIIK